MNWTDGRRKGFITSTIRGGFRRWPPKFETIKEAFVEKKTNPKSGKTASFYKCSSCEEDFVQKEIQVDHKAPVVDPKKGFIDWDTFIDRLFCPATNLQILCIACHKEKTKREKDIANKTRSKNSK